MLALPVALQLLAAHGQRLEQPRHRHRRPPLARCFALLALDFACALELDHGPDGGLGGGCGCDGDGVGEGAEGGEGLAAEAEGDDGVEVGEGGELGSVVFEGWNGGELSATYTTCGRLEDRE